MTSWWEHGQEEVSSAHGSRKQRERKKIGQGPNTHLKVTAPMPNFLPLSPTPKSSISFQVCYRLTTKTLAYRSLGDTQTTADCKQIKHSLPFKASEFTKKRI
jgi:hypothetical protein